MSNNPEIIGSCSWIKWRADGTPSPESKGHYLVWSEGDEVALCGATLPDTNEAEFSGGVYVDCKRCQKKELNQ